MSREHSLTTLLKNPPYKYKHCAWCGDTGIINCRGYRQSDTCDRCYGRNKGTEEINYVQWRKQIIDCVKETSK